MALLNYTGERRTIRFDRLTSPIFGFAVAVVLLSVATHAFAQRDDGFYVSAAYMTTFTGAHDFEVGVKPAENADFVANRNGTGSFDIGFLGFPRGRRLQHLRVPARGRGFIPPAQGLRL